MRLGMLGLASAGAFGACNEYRIGDDPKPLPVPVTATTAPTALGPRPPIADAGPDTVRRPLEVVTLDGTRSYDPDGEDIVAVAWTLADRPEGSTTSVSAPGHPRPELFLDLAGSYRLTLNVQNRPGLWDPTPDELVIEAVPEDALYVQLFWDAENDLDLHLLDGDTSGLFGGGDCNFCNMTPEWGSRGPLDDPSLDWDAIFGFGPEAISIEEPAAGAYEIAVHYFGEEGLDQCVGPCGPSVATVLVFVDGELAGKFAGSLTDQGDLWRVAQVQWPGGIVVEIDDLTHTSQSFCH